MEFVSAAITGSYRAAWGNQSADLTIKAVGGRNQKVVPNSLSPRAALPSCLYKFGCSIAQAQVWEELRRLLFPACGHSLMARQKSDPGADKKPRAPKTASIPSSSSHWPPSLQVTARGKAAMQPVSSSAPSKLGTVKQFACVFAVGVLDVCNCHNFYCLHIKQNMCFWSPSAERVQLS